MAASQDESELMDEMYPALHSAMLPQYRQSPAFMERFLTAIHEEGVDIIRSESRRGTKFVEDHEVKSDSLDYFLEKPERFWAEFKSDLLDEMAEADVELFCRVISENWYDGRGKRSSGDCQRLKKSIQQYLYDSGCPADAMLIQGENELKDFTPLISVEDVAAILRVNDRMLYRHIEAWKEIHPNSDEMSSDDVFLRRGLALKDNIDVDKGYLEWDYISSYSLAFTLPEQFSDMARREGGTPALVNGVWSTFDNRVLFFSPFIPNMDAGQLEFGIIPGFKPLPIKFQREVAGVLEYLIDPAPFHM